MLSLMSEFINKPYLRWLTLFLTTGTLLCCAMPILLVALDPIKPVLPILCWLLPCQAADTWNQRIFWLSAVICGVGFFFSILLLPLRQLLNL